MEATAAKLIGREKITAATARRRSSDAADEGQHRAVVLQPLGSHWRARTQRQCVEAVSKDSGIWPPLERTCRQQPVQERSQLTQQPVRALLDTGVSYLDEYYKIVICY